MSSLISTKAIATIAGYRASYRVCDDAFDSRQLQTNGGKRWNLHVFFYRIAHLLFQKHLDLAYYWGWKFIVKNRFQDKLIIDNRLIFQMIAVSRSARNNTTSSTNRCKYLWIVCDEEHGINCYKRLVGGWNNLKQSAACNFILFIKWKIESRQRSVSKWNKSVRKMITTNSIEVTQLLDLLRKKKPREFFTTRQPINRKVQKIASDVTWVIRWWQETIPTVIQVLCCFRV